MERKSIGSFIAALRRANGMTQQDLADKLNVSNKAVSRWERDETLPDLTLIPVIAEIFGVTCDEILRGERAIPPEPSSSRTSEDEEAASRAEARAVQKSERRAAAIVDRALARFRTAAIVSIALIIVGVIVMFLIGMFYQGGITVIGLTVMLIFDVVAAVVTILATLRLREACGGEIAESCDEKTVVRYERTMTGWSYAVFAIIFLIIWFTFTMPMLSVVTEVSGSNSIDAIMDPYGNEIEFEPNPETPTTQNHGLRLIEVLFVFVCPAAILVLMYDPYVRFVTGKRAVEGDPDPVLREFRIITIALGSASVLLMFLDRIWWLVFPGTNGWISMLDIVQWLCIISFFAVAVADIVFIAVRRGQRLDAAVRGVRALLITLGAMFIVSSNSYHIYDGEFSHYVDPKELMTGVTVILITAAVSRFILKRISKGSPW